MKRKPKKDKSILLRLFVLVVCGYFTFSLVSLWGDLNTEKDELKNEQAKLSAAQNEVAELKAMLEDESDTPIIVKALRDRLGYIYSDEQVFIDVSGN